MAPHLIQNFKGYHASIFASQSSLTDTLESTLARIGLGSVKTYDAEAITDTDFDSFGPQRDVLFVDSDIEFVAALSKSTSLSSPPVPTIGLVGIGTPGRLKGLLNIGCTAFLGKPVHDAAVYSALFLGINQFQARHEMEWRIGEQERRRRGRRWVIKAVVALMRQSTITDDEAYAKLRQDSMRMRVNLETYCERFAMDSAQDSLRPEGEPPVDMHPAADAKRAGK